MQLMSERGLEKTVTKGLGWIAGDVKLIEPSDPSLKIPQIGWNTLTLTRPHRAVRRHKDWTRRAARLFRAFLPSGDQTARRHHGDWPIMAGR
jgi:hypothetical protein